MEVFQLQQQQAKKNPVRIPPQASPCSIFPLSSQQFQFSFRANLFTLPSSPLVSSNRRLNASYPTKYSKWDSNEEKMSSRRLKDGDDDETRSRRKKRRWWSVDFDDDELSDENVGVFEEAIDSIWIFKVFRSYGWTLPFVALSLLLATGPKAFLMALALSIGQSLLTLALRKFFGGNHRSKSRATATSWTNWIPKAQTEQRMAGFHSRTEDGGQGNLNYGKSTTRGKRSKYSNKFDTPLLLRLLIAVFPFLGS